jgi:putative transposase
VVTEAYVLGVSTRQVEAPVPAIGSRASRSPGWSSSPKAERVESFRKHSPDRGSYPYVWLGALIQRCREGGRVVNVATGIATAVNADGHREILGGLHH